MIRIAITAEAYEAIERTLALGTGASEPQPNANGERVIWIEERWLDTLNSIRRSCETTRRPSSGWPRCGKDIGHISDAEQAPAARRAQRVILRVAQIEARGEL